MKRAVVFLGVCVFMLGMASAGYVCDDGSEIKKDVREVSKASVKAIKQVGIGVCEADEAAAISRFYAELIVDAEKKTILNDTSSSQISLLSGNYTVSFSSARGSIARISIDGTSKEIGVGECDNIGNFEVMLVGLEFNNDIASVEVIVGSKRLDISNTENDKIVEISSEKYLFQIVSGSDVQAGISVGKCESGNLIEIADNENINQTEVINETETNETEIDNNQTEIVSSNETLILNETIEEKQVGEACEADEDCATNRCNSGICAEKGFLQKILDWFANLIK